ncbi:MAG: hypothetical protein WKG06_11740 [Segetibacter sp.]
MKTQKMSLANIQGKLSRAEMKNIMAGSGSGGNCYTLSTGSGGSSSCWYATGSNGDTLCQRVYPGKVCISSLNMGTGQCTSDCHMN